jgi:hypothetical protein
LGVDVYHSRAIGAFNRAEEKEHDAMRMQENEKAEADRDAVAAGRPPDVAGQ